MEFEKRPKKKKIVTREMILDQQIFPAQCDPQDSQDHQQNSLVVKHLPLPFPETGSKQLGLLTVLRCPVGSRLRGASAASP